MLDRHPFWSKGAVSSPLSHFWHILSYYFLLIWLAGVEWLIPLVSVFGMVDGEVAGRGLTTHSCLIHSLYTSRVSLHPHCLCYCQMSIRTKLCMNQLCVCVYVFVSISTCSVHHGGTAAESVWRQAAIERHPSWTLPSWSTHEHMHTEKCIHFYHQLWEVLTVNNIVCTIHTCRRAHPTFSTTPICFVSHVSLLLCLFRLWSS